MSENFHERAQALFAQSLIEGISTAEQATLEAHLRECGECARQVAQARELLHALRQVPVATPSDLAARTQLRVRLRLQQPAEASDRSMLLWVITGGSWLLGVFSATVVWRVFSWLGTRMNVPKPVWEMGVVLWWAIPALIAVTVVLQQRMASNGIAGRRSR